MKTTILSFSVPMLAGLFLGCASTPPPRELLDARAAYSRAEHGPGAPLAPVPIHEAKLALNAAEQAYDSSPDAMRTRDLAYVADRKAKLAESQGDVAADSAARAQAERDVAQMQASQLAQAQQGLQATKGELSRTQDRLNMTADQLAAEKVARSAADKRAHEAMEKLALAAALAVKEEPRGTVIVMPGSVLFASAKWELLAGAREKLNAVAQALKDQDDRKVLVEGHTDSQGSESSNLELGRKRAQAVTDYLISQGVKPEVITAIGIGQARPVADNKSPEGRADNRRVEIVVSPVEKR